MAQSCFRSLGHFARVAVVSLAILFASGAQAQGGQALLGIYYGNQGWGLAQVRAMETWQGKRHAVVNLFTDWCNRSKSIDNLFKQQLPNIWANGNVPLVTWEPFLCSAAATPSDITARVVKGEYDVYLKAWAARMKAFVSGPDGQLGTGDDRRAYIRLAHEMNGNWYPWSAPVGSGSAENYIAMWRHVRTIFAGLDSNHVQWIWAVNHEDVGTVRAEDYYPGHVYVDWIGIDGYNWGSSQTWSAWRTPDEVFSPMLHRLRQISAKPLALTETASSTAMPARVDVAAKSLWITDLFNYATAFTTNARMIVWFNEDKETDWAVFGGLNGDETYRSGRTTYKAYRSYKAAVQNVGLIPSMPSAPQLITDERFSGSW